MHKWLVRMQGNHIPGILLVLQFISSPSVPTLYIHFIKRKCRYHQYKQLFIFIPFVLTLYIFYSKEVLLSPIERTVIDDSIDSDLPPLQFPDDDFWNVFVTVANSTLEIWLRIIGTEYSVSVLFSS